MDIRKWLDETVLPHQPPSPIERKRKACASDSSLLDAPPRRKPSPSVEIEESPDESAESDASHPSSGTSSPSQPYAPRPRRKTRPERYEPTAKDGKERGSHGRRHQKGESTQTKPKSRRKKVDKGSIGQNFHAQNVPKDRLTLKSQEKPGLFNKGRASSAVKGRGLPDLVFSEMKFLQSQRAQPEPDPLRENATKKRKKVRSHAKDADMSAYFAAVRPALAEKDVNTQAKEGTRRERLQENDRCKQHSAPAVTTAIPTVESTDHASYLAFGSRGPNQANGSYISWSESIRAPSDMPARRRIGSSTNIGQLDPIHDEQTKGDTASGVTLHSQAAVPSVIRQMPGGSGGRFQLSSLPPANSRLSRSHSLPQRTSSPQRVNLIDRAAKRRTLESATSPFSMPPLAAERTNLHTYQPAHVDASVESRGAAFTSQQQNNVHRETNNSRREQDSIVSYEMDPRTSSSFERLTLNCNTKFNEMRRTNASPDVDPAPSNIPIRGGARALLGSLATVQRTPTVRFGGVEEIRRPTLNSFSGPGIYELQAQRQSDNNQQPAYPSFDTPQEPYLDENGYFGMERMDYDRQGWEGPSVPYEADFTERPDDLDKLYEVEPRRDGIVEPNTATARTGFWRPHKLY
ncbi:hypothetical protein P280DRAFT_414355 [Massarina eburnea CBS 473.64]|uniref:Uncharacterized protein n=1 Tax=Massarina eburnea CBS 473.64 TaxID=1395130 RepID=A0A6A6RFG5_9PLEO|nr:hypothetical protein P280DRAFT_414355 [Massarina eburnea CBS 473.64]